MEKVLQCLLVDDDLDDQEIFLMALEETNKNVKFFTASDGVEALFMLNEEQGLVPDYIFLDVNMSKMNGIECLINIKKIEYLKDVKVFMYSTTSENWVMEKSKELGALDFIIKPATHAVLKEILARILR